MTDSIQSSKEPPLKDIDEEAGGTDEGTFSSSDSSDDEWTGEYSELERNSPIRLHKDQREIAQHALQGKNTIIFSVPGSGKTWIAMHIAWMHLQDKTKSPRKIVFMARTGALIKQQAETFQKYLGDLKTKLISAQDQDESSYVAMYVEQYDIICLTPQILINSLESKVVKSLSEFSLMIFDECHHTKGETPYNRLMRKYLLEKSVCKNERLPQIVGLTGSVGIGNARTEKDAVDQILKLCANLDVRNLSVVDKHIKSLQKRTSIPNKEIIQLDKTHGDGCKGVIIGAMIEIEALLEDNALMQPDLIEMITDRKPSDRESQEYNNWANEIKMRAQLNFDDSNVSRDICSCARYLMVYNSAMELNKLLLPTDVIKYLATKFQQEGQNIEKLTQLETQLYQILKGVQKSLNQKNQMKGNRNVHILSNKLEELMKEQGKDSRAIVAVKTRATCKSLATYLNKSLETSAIRVSPLYGKDDRNGEEGMTDDVQTKCLEKFREGSYKVIVCTSVGNEGIDIPDCNIVLSYEYSGDEITSIQLRGRARKSDALAITMGSQKIVEQEKRNAFKEELMCRALEEFKKLDQVNIERKISFIQQDNMTSDKMKVEFDLLKKAKKEMITNLDQDLLCAKCNAFACHLSDIRKMEHDHIVLNNEFKDKVKKRIHKKPMTYGGVRKKYKISCIKCPNDWGIVGEKGGLEYMILKIKQFKFKDNDHSGVISKYKNWNGFSIPALTLEDLRKLNERKEEEELPQNGSEMVKSRNTDVSCPVEESQSRTKMCETKTNLKRAASDEALASSKKCKLDEAPTDVSVEPTQIHEQSEEATTACGISGDEDTSENSQSSSSAGYPFKKSHNDTLSEPLAKSLIEKMESVGALVFFGNGLGTVFMVGTKYVMTAWHVVEHIIDQNKCGHIDASALEDNNIFVAFGSSPISQDRSIYFLTKNLLWDSDLDVAVLEIANPDEYLPKSLNLCRDENVCDKLEDVSFIGYGHPQETGKHLDPRCKILSPDHAQIRKAQKWLKEKSSELKSVFKLTGKDPGLVENGYRGIDHPDKLIFHCYIQQGGSGSPALTNNNPRSVKVVGILTHGLPEFFYNLDDKNRAVIQDEYRFEVGTKMTSIYASIYNKNPILALELFGT